jgi:hypothetical protein
MNTGYFPAQSAVSQPISKGGETNWRRRLAKSVNDGWSWVLESDGAENPVKA